MVASTNHLDQLDPGLSSRPSRFDRKYLFPSPSTEERVLYCEYWRNKLASKPSIKFPKKLCGAIAGITQDFSFAYLKEAFVATLLAIAGNRSEDEIRSGGDDEGGDLDDYELWREMKKQVKLLRDDMDTHSSPGPGSSQNLLDGAQDISWKFLDAPCTSLQGQLPYRKKNGANKEQNPRLAGAVVDCDFRGAPIMTDDGRCLHSKFHGVDGKELL